jgi:hypothetical protein
MSTAAVGGAAGAAAAALMQAVKASGVIVRVEPLEFLNLVGQQEAPLIVQATVLSIFFSTRYQYLTSYKGLAFYAQSSEPLDLPADTELVQAQRIWVPG